MKTEINNSTDINISVSNIFSNSHFKKAIANPDYPLLEKKLEKYQDVFGLGFKSRKDALDTLYDYMLTNYRCEYVYKNFITKTRLLGRHNLNTTNLINEFRVGSSLADIVLVNGTSTVFEIKTELDSPDRLSDQLQDYQKAFTRVYIVTHYTQSDRYLELVDDSSVGLMVLTKRNHLSKRKEAQKNTSSLDITTMFKSLRKPEYSNIISKYFGEVPDVPNMFYFKECLKLAKQIDPVEFHQLMNEQLKKRKPSEKEILSSQVPNYLANICLSIDPSREQYQQLFNYLNKKI